MQVMVLRLDPVMLQMQLVKNAKPLKKSLMALQDHDPQEVKDRLCVRAGLRLDHLSLQR